MKKILAILICIQLVVVPAFADYDFSDEAQAEFDRQQQQTTQPVRQKSVDKRDLKNKQTDNNSTYTPIYTPTYTPTYTPADTPLYTPTPTYTASPDNGLLYDASKEDLVKQAEEQQKKLYGSVVRVPSGTSFDVTFDSGISSGSMAKDDRLTVRLTDDLEYNGQLIAPAGSLVYGRTTDAKSAGYAYGSGAIEFDFYEILTPDGNRIKISTKKIVMKAKSERATKMTRDVVVGALGSMLIGALFTSLGSTDPNWGRSMLVYGSIGAAAGGLHGAMNQGTDIKIPDGTTIKLTLTDVLTANPYSE